jgi:hypothetical protein
MLAALTFAALTCDPRIAFLLLAGLIIGAAVPLAIGWTRLLPEERPPFEDENAQRRTPPPLVSIYSTEPEERKWDVPATVLLVLLTVGFALQFPGVPREIGLNALPDHLPGAEGWFEIALPCLQMVVAAAAIFYGAIRKSFLKVQLIAAGVLVLLMWLFAPWLYGALAAS